YMRGQQVAGKFYSSLVINGLTFHSKPFTEKLANHNSSGVKVKLDSPEEPYAYAEILEIFHAEPRKQQSVAVKVKWMEILESKVYFCTHIYIYIDRYVYIYID